MSGPVEESDAAGASDGGASMNETNEGPLDLAPEEERVEVAAEEDPIEPEADGASPAEPLAEPAHSRLESILESLLFASGSPVALRRISEVLDGPSPKEIKRALEHLSASYESEGRGIRLVAVAGGYQFRTAPQNAEWVRALLRERPVRLGRAALETLAVVAYKQPVTRAEIEAIRGVDADSALSSLLAKRLIKIAGRKEAVGRPLLYATTAEFLEVFGLEDLNHLPALKEIGPAPEPDDESSEDIEDEGASGEAHGWGATPEDPEPSRDQLAPAGGGDDPGAAGEGERAYRDGARDEGGPEPGPDHR